MRHLYTLLLIILAITLAGCAHKGVLGDERVGAYDFPEFERPYAAVYHGDAYDGVDDAESASYVELITSSAYGLELEEDEPDDGSRNYYRDNISNVYAAVSIVHSGEGLEGKHTVLRTLAGEAQFDAGIIDTVLPPIHSGRRVEVWTARAYNENISAPIMEYEQKLRVDGFRTDNTTGCFLKRDGGYAYIFIYQPDDDEGEPYDGVSWSVTSEDIYDSANSSCINEIEDEGDDEGWD
jgi:hypothetical protein